MVLEPGEPGHAELGIDVGDDLTHPAAFPAAAPDVEDAQALNGLALDAAELGAHHLVARAHREDHGPGGGGRAEPAVGAQPLGGEDLRQVLAAAHQVDVARAGHRLVRVHLDGLGLDAAEPGPALQHEQVAAVAVGAQQVRVDPHQPEAARAVVAARAGGPGPVGLPRSWRAVAGTVIGLPSVLARGAQAPGDTSGPGGPDPLTLTGPGPGRS